MGFLAVIVTGHDEISLAAKGGHGAAVAVGVEHVIAFLRRHLIIDFGRAHPV
jgi:hypothetical protein